MSKRWLATLPPDLQKIVRDDGTKVSKDVIPFVKEFFAKQTNIWKSQGRRADQAAGRPSRRRCSRRSSTIGEDLSKDKPELNKAVKMVFEVANRK